MLFESVRRHPPSEEEKDAMEKRRTRARNRGRKARAGNANFDYTKLTKHALTAPLYQARLEQLPQCNPTASRLRP